MKTLRTRLDAPFDGYYTADGVHGPFLSGEQVVVRLNDVFGVGGWKFRVVTFGVHEEADEAWALGELSARVGIEWVTMQQFGGQKVHRLKATGAPQNIADDHKGAATDALKKCASLYGIGLYMMVSTNAVYHAGVPPKQAAAARARQAELPKPKPVNGTVATTVTNRAGPWPDKVEVDGHMVPACQTCGAPLASVKTRSGVWSAAQLSYRGKRRHGLSLCATHYAEAEKQFVPQAASA